MYKATIIAAERTERIYKTYEAKQADRRHILCVCVCCLCISCFLMLSQDRFVWSGRNYFLFLFRKNKEYCATNAHAQLKIENLKCLHIHNSTLMLSMFHYFIGFLKGNSLKIQQSTEPHCDLAFSCNTENACTLNCLLRPRRPLLLPFVVDE